VIALDTNILLRYLVQDGGVQAQLATSLIENDITADTPGYVSIPVICELVWALQTTYGQKRETIAQSVAYLIEAEQIEIEAPKIVSAAIVASGCDIADAIIHEVGQSAGASKTLTFDKKFARLKDVELLK
jgi:predicted nucleic-acid-binding protein